MNINFSCATDSGNKRSINEDNLWPRPAEPHPHLDSPYGALFLIADGMGGYQAGDVASRLAADTIAATYYAPQDTSSDITQRLDRAIQAAQKRLQAEATQNPDTAKMGTTVVAVVIKYQGNMGQIWVAWVGDSRLYHWSPSEHLRQLTEDHTELWGLVQAGEIPWENLHYHPLRSKVTKSLSARHESVEVSHTKYNVRPGDKLLLCSDGLSSELRDIYIDAIMSDHQPEAATAKLIDQAKAPKTWLREGEPVESNGGEDNITVIAIKFEAAPAQAVPPDKPAIQSPAPPPSTRPQSSRSWIVGAVMLFVVAIVVGAGVVLLALNMRSPARVAEATATPIPTEPPPPTEPPSPTSAPVVSIGPTATPIPQPTAEVIVASPTATPTTVSPTATRVPETATLVPTIALSPQVVLPTPALTATTTIITGTPTLTATAPIITDTPTLTATAPITTTPTPAAEFGPIELLAPASDAVIPVTDIKFQWQYGTSCGELPEGYGFEVKVARQGSMAPMVGAMNAVEQQAEVICEGNGIYSFVVGNVLAASGMTELPGTPIDWSVWIVALNPYGGVQLAANEAIGVFRLEEEAGAN